jgi:hypothetical protein
MESARAAIKFIVYELNHLQLVCMRLHKFMITFA